jgi:hypothetical protein
MVVAILNLTRHQYSLDAGRLAQEEVNRILVNEKKSNMKMGDGRIDESHAEVNHVQPVLTTCTMYLATGHDLVLGTLKVVIFTSQLWRTKHPG